MSSVIELYEHNQKAYDALATLAVQRWLEQWLVAE